MFCSEISLFHCVISIFSPPDPRYRPQSWQRECPRYHELCATVSTGDHLGGQTAGSLDAPRHTETNTVTVHTWVSNSYFKGFSRTSWEFSGLPKRFCHMLQLDKLKLLACDSYYPKYSSLLWLLVNMTARIFAEQVMSTCDVNTWRQPTLGRKGKWLTSLCVYRPSTNISGLSWNSCSLFLSLACESDIWWNLTRLLDTSLIMSQVLFSSCRLSYKIHIESCR